MRQWQKLKGANEGAVGPASCVRNAKGKVTNIQGFNSVDEGTDGLLLGREDTNVTASNLLGLKGADDGVEEDTEGTGTDRHVLSEYKDGDNGPLL